MATVDDLIKKIKDNFSDLNKKIELKNNPNPIYIVCLMIGYMVVIYFMYIFIIKTDISGTWKDSGGIIYKINHNKFNDNIVIYQNCKKTIGVMHGNLIIVRNDSNDNMGVYLNNRIKWIHEKIWYKID
jgi:hypothetical protein